MIMMTVWYGLLFLFPLREILRRLKKSLGLYGFGVLVITINTYIYLYHCVTSGRRIAQIWALEKSVLMHTLCSNTS